MAGLAVIPSIGGDECGAGGMQGDGVIEGVEQVVLVTDGKLQGGSVDFRGIQDALLNVEQILQVRQRFSRLQARQNGCDFCNEMGRLYQRERASCRPFQNLERKVSMIFVWFEGKKPFDGHAGIDDDDHVIAGRIHGRRGTLRR